MNLFEKIEEIRQKPEHVRMKYVWLMVCIFSVIIISIWWFSLKSSQFALDSTISKITNSKEMTQINEQAASLKATASDVKNVIGSQGK